LTDDDLAVVGRLGLRTVIDLRSGSEVDLQPDRLPEDGGIKRHHLPMSDPVNSEDVDPLLDRIQRGEVTDFDGMLRDFYLEMLDRSARAFGEIVSHAATAERLPLLFHCAGGKDRTGVAAALTLSILGVNDEDIVADYALTEGRLVSLAERWRPAMAEMGFPDEAITPLLGAQPAVMSATLEAVRARYGSVEDFLTGPGEADPAAFEALRSLVLEPRDP
jgi:protein-tyrosine phosphatase